MIAAGTPRKGFTLLEVILALTIFVGSIAVLSRLIIVGVENAEMADWQSQAWLIAESRWAEIESGVRSLSDSGPFPVDEMPGWEWTFQLESMSMPALYRVTLAVRKQEQGPIPGPSIELSRFLFDDSSLRSEETTQ